MISLETVQDAVRFLDQIPASFSLDDLKTRAEDDGDAYDVLYHLDCLLAGVGAEPEAFEALVVAQSPLLTATMQDNEIWFHRCERWEQVKDFLHMKELEEQRRQAKIFAKQQAEAKEREQQVLAAEVRLLRLIVEGAQQTTSAPPEVIALLQDAATGQITRPVAELDDLYALYV